MFIKANTIAPIPNNAHIISLHKFQFADARHTSYTDTLPCEKESHMLVCTGQKFHGRALPLCWEWLKSHPPLDSCLKQLWNRDSGSGFHFYGKADLSRLPQTWDIEQNRHRLDSRYYTKKIGKRSLLLLIIDHNCKYFNIESGGFR